MGPADVVAAVVFAVGLPVPLYDVTDHPVDKET